MSEEDGITAEAVRWHLASTGDDMDWDGFTAWLEADPRHRAQFDTVALADDLVVAHRDLLGTGIHAEPEERARPHRRRWAGGAVAACLIAALGFGFFARPSETIYASTTTAQVVALNDGSRIDLAPHSRLAVSADGASIRLEGGAYFAIRHTPTRTLAISAGPVVISDIGTRFDVQSAAGTVRVAVAEGAISIASPGLDHRLTLARGRSLVFDLAASRVSLGDTDPDSAGAWREGRLTYADVPLALVVDDLARYAGARVAVSDNLRDRRFSGTLVTSDGNKPMRDLAQLMGLELVRDAGGYRLVEPAR